MDATDCSLDTSTGKFTIVFGEPYAEWSPKWRQEEVGRLLGLILGVPKPSRWQRLMRWLGFRK